MASSTEIIGCECGRGGVPGPPGGVEPTLGSGGGARRDGRGAAGPGLVCTAHSYLVSHHYCHLLLLLPHYGIGNRSASKLSLFYTAIGIFFLIIFS